ncbi:MAG: dihydrolipoyl dehydrogenase [Candidatus Nitrohelix vancouverensis]|uniref:Dihydrolipoyl dehydrogenase n=1 Tax=Candidatus Nitrohelix vancouverensis TaxID=2705534 RepID=A0A7T0C5I8_9BACT|nr:MAG: dihydrolipoyl dehydrogenase [Candidatus Nitrohelix vancouverensis]
MISVDLLVIGGGPGGYHAAFDAADRGMKVALADENATLGGVCLNRGCIPSKALLHVAALIQETRRASEWGATYADPSIDLDKLRAWKDATVQRMAKGLDELARQRKVQTFQGRAKLTGASSAEIAGHGRVEFKHCLLATGSRPKSPSLFHPLGNLLMDSTSALALENIPQKLLVLGGGYIGLEMGTVYAALGSRVTVVEMQSALLPGVDSDLVRPLARNLASMFETIHLDTKVTSASIVNGEVQVGMQKGSEETLETFSKILVSVGREPNTQALGLEHTAVQLEEGGFIKTDSNGRTDEPGIFAIGDIVAGAMLAHKASHDAQRAINWIERGEAGKSSVIPAVVFTDPEIAWCGLSETDARRKGIAFHVSRFPWSASGRAQAMGRGEGLTKLILEPESNKILGMGVVGVNAGELIGEGVLAMNMGASAKDLAHAVHPHPTLSETISEAAFAGMGQAIHIYKRPRK